MSDTVRALERWQGSGEGAVPLLEACEASLTEELPIWHDYLEETSRPRFLQALGSDELRRRWAETAFAIIRRSDYRLEDMLARRADEIGDQALFEELEHLGDGWTYGRVRRQARGFAAVFLADRGADARVALYLDNSVDGACCDLACLLHDILVTPLSVHFDPDDLAWVFDRLRINIVVTDSEERLRRLRQTRERVREPFTLYALHPGRTVERGQALALGEVHTHLAPEHIDALLEARPRRPLDEVCTVMFTSGSTGRPKGVAFTPFNLISKRFARAAALPDVGRDEKLLCYLPLYHTFGRYLEMLGTIFWRGTYVFAGNPSAETLMAGLRRVRPTGLISIPMRWAQLRDRIVSAEDAAKTRRPDDTDDVEGIADITGGRLRWGLSAAGYLDPKVFRFFQRNGIELCSGFGMTEATGGITMSPPGDYQDDTVGVPLPGTILRFTDAGEMLIGGAYVARYLTEDGSALELAPPLQLDGESWLATGDIFQDLERGHVSIVDRIKDIYKNARGQTIAPRRVEREFEGVPGIRRTFLVGDRRSHNTLLIVPDATDPVLAQNEEGQHEYFHQIVATANQRLAPYERVVTYALIDRDFSTDHGEVTAKGSLRRKVILEHFATVVEDLYGNRYVELEVAPDLHVRMPHWFHRDLGVLEDDVVATATGLLDRRRGLELPIWRRPEESAIGVGDLEYVVEGDIVNLGAMSRQPRLWLGNPALIRFAPCKEGWDVGMGPFQGQVLLPTTRDRTPAAGTVPGAPEAPGFDDRQLVSVNDLVEEALFAPDVDALLALQSLSSELGECDDRLDATVRHRIKALARHPCEELRCLAYRVLLLDRPTHGYNEAFGSFIRSGLPFLNKESIRAIASTHLERRRLEALRQRLYRYRQELTWPADATARRQFEDILRLLVEFVRFHPKYYKPVRSELACWVLHREDPELARHAEQRMDEMVGHFEKRVERLAQRSNARLQPNQVVFDEDISEGRRPRLLELLTESAFLEQSLLLAFDEHRFDPRRVPPGGIWISAERAGGPFQYYRLSINTARGRHFQLLVVLLGDADAQRVADTNHWMMVIAGHPFEPRAMPRFGCVRPGLAAMSLEYVDEPNVDEKIRQYASVHPSQRGAREQSDWRKLYVRAMATVLRAWDYSGRRIVPGSIRPANVVVPELDSRQTAFLLSLAGWRPFERRVDLFRALHSSFYLRTIAHHPVCADVLSVDWIFDACLEGLGENEGTALLRDLQIEIAQRDAPDIAPGFADRLALYLDTLPGRYHVPLPLQNAIDRYHRWRRSNPGVTPAARTDEIESLVRVYHLEQLGEPARYHLYRQTFFAAADPETVHAFDRLLSTLVSDPDRPATQRVELSDLQATLSDPDDRQTFGRMVFPRASARAGSPIDVLAVGVSGYQQVTLRTWITDRHGERYGVREPLEAEEVGQVYRLFLREHMPMTASELDRYLVTLDSTERLVAGIVYKVQEPEVIHIHGLVVKSAVSARGIATALLDDFLDRMASRGVRVVKTDFMMRGFGEKRGFAVDRRWGGLVRFVGSAPHEVDPD